MSVDYRGFVERNDYLWHLIKQFNMVKKNENLIIK